MATVAPPAEQAADLLQKFSLDSHSKTMDDPELKKKYEPIDSSNAANSKISSERVAVPSAQDCVDSSMCYVPNAYSPTYYYGGSDPNGQDWDEFSRYLNPDGVDITSGIYGDNGSVMYHPAYGYAPYGPYSPAASPIPTMGNDGQLYGPQHYQYPPYFQPLTPTSAPFTPRTAAASQRDVLASVTADQKPSPVETANTNSNGAGNGGSMKGNNGTAALKPTYQGKSFSSAGSYGGNALPGRSPSGHHDPRYGFDGFGSPIPWLDGPLYSDGQSRTMNGSTMSSSISSGNNFASRNLNYRPNSHLLGLHHPSPVSGMNTSQGFINRMYPNKLYSHYGHAVRSSMSYGSHGYDSRANGRQWLAFDSKYKSRGRTGGYCGYGNENVDAMNELNKGPRAKGKNQRSSVPTVPEVKGQTLQPNAIDDTEKDKMTAASDYHQYNKTDFPEEYTDARFFVIKSYSEDDVHKSIKYNVWASTPNGNKKLDAAYYEAQQKPGSCPIFLFFSVNTSGQFVGLAEMVGPVDFHKNVEYWQQDKWNGCFPVKWHMVKDVPNSLLKHITLENNENKPVTNSRDTQEVKLEPGLKMVKIFKEHISKTCILDDFGFYEERQKSIQEKKVKQHQFLKQTAQSNLVCEGKCGDVQKEAACVDVNTQKTSEAGRDLSKDSIPTEQANNVKLSDKVSEGNIGDALKGTNSVEKRIEANGVTNGC